MGRRKIYTVLSELYRRFKTCLTCHSPHISRRHRSSFGDQNSACWRKFKTSKNCTNISKLIRVGGQSAQISRGVICEQQFAALKRMMSGIEEQTPPHRIFFAKSQKQNALGRIIMHSRINPRISAVSTPLSGVKYIYVCVCVFESVVLYVYI